MPQTQYVVSYQMDTEVIVTDILVILGIVIGIIVLREALCYFFRLNQLQQKVEDMNMCFHELRKELKRVVIKLS